MCERANLRCSKGGREDGKLVAEGPSRIKGLPSTSVSANAGYPYVGGRDLLNPNVMRDHMHDWVVANHRMYKVLRDKGYQYQYSYALDSGHCDASVRDQTLPQAIGWVWRGHRAP